jgi:hypothetical protein
MNKLIELKYNLDFNLIGGNNDIADFIPYSDHYKMSEEKKPEYYCPDMFPFLCNEKSNAKGLCRRSINECKMKNINGIVNKFPIKYKKLN